ncbi:MAG: SCO family protein, partial [Deltaproteobacteria bacterium]|nr:SCO family protein [Deltaproteobacteria bacterium]
PPTFQANTVNVIEHLGAKLPHDARFRTHDGKAVSLGEVLTGDLPTILTFNYADCPMLCSQQLNGLTAAMPETAKPHVVPGADKEIALVLGEHYRIVTISLEPDESVAKLTKMRGKYLERIKAKPDDKDAKWTYLTGDALSIKRVADVVGFGYTYIPDRAEWAHPAAFIFVSSAGAITRYVYGIEFPAGVLGESIYKAGLAESSTAAGFMFRCYHYDPAAKDHSRAGVLALRIGAASCVALLAAFGIMQLVRRKPRREVS